jgi:hypothetical protein
VRRIEVMMNAVSGPSPQNIDKYFNSVQKDLERRFANSRLLNTDSEAKGVAHERIVGETVESYLQPSRPTYRRQIIDSSGNSSDEVDVIFCNWAQPSVKTELLLAEGVDYAIGVKSVLTKDEIGSLTTNAASVKKLQRRLGTGEIARANDVAREWFIDRIPYIGFALESELKFSTARRYIEEFAAAEEPDSQIDAMFIMGRGALINSRSMLRVEDEPVEGWIERQYPDKVLLEFLNFAIGIIPRIVRNGSALRSYLNQAASLLMVPTPEYDAVFVGYY